MIHEDDEQHLQEIADQTYSRHHEGVRWIPAALAVIARSVVALGVRVQRLEEDASPDSH